MSVCKHCNRAPVDVAVNIAADMSYTGEARRAIKPVDACIADIVACLNANPNVVVTTSSCCGHGESTPEILLHDGRVLRVEGGSDNG